MSEQESGEEKPVGLMWHAMEEFRWRMVYRGYRKRYEIHPSFRFNGPGIRIYDSGRVILGEGSYIGRYSSIQSGKGCKVVVGRNCSVSHFVMMYTQNRDPDQDFSKACADVKGDIVIGDHCWVGARVFINHGVEIGENSVVGANSVATRSLPPHSISAGTPAKVIKFKSYLDEASMLGLARRYEKSIDDRLRRSLEEKHPGLFSKNAATVE